MPQAEVEHHRPVLDQQVVVAAAAVGDGGSPSPLRRASTAGPVGDELERAARRCGRAAVASRRPARTAPCRPGAAGRASSARRSTTVAGQTKPPRLGPVGAEQDRHVAGEVDRADGVRRVVDVRRVQARPRRRRRGPSAACGPIEPHAGAGRVEVDLPVGARRSRVDVRRGEELRRRVRALERRRCSHAAPSDGPVGRRAPARRGRASAPAAARRTSPGAQRPAAVAAEAAQRERRPRCRGTRGTSRPPPRPARTCAGPAPAAAPTASTAPARDRRPAPTAATGVAVDA